MTTFRSHRQARYENEKKSHGGARSSCTSCGMRTDEKIAEETKVCPRTVRNDAEFARAGYGSMALCMVLQTMP